MIFKKTEILSGEMVTLDAAKAQCRVGDDEDSYIAGLITTARMMIEAYCSCHIVQKAGVFYLDRFPAGEISLASGPCISIDAVKYLDTEGVEQVLDEDCYVVDVISTAARIKLAPGRYWPMTSMQPNAVRIEAIVGLEGGGGEDLINITGSDEKPLLQAQLLLINHLYDNHLPVQQGSFSEMPWSIGSMVEDYRIYHI